MTEAGRQGGREERGGEMYHSTAETESTLAALLALLQRGHCSGRASDLPSASPTVGEEGAPDLFNLSTIK